MFTLDGLEHCTKELLENRENYWIDSYKTLDSSYGYNKVKADRTFINPATYVGKVMVIAIPPSGQEILFYTSVADCRRSLHMNETKVFTVLKYWDTTISDSDKHGLENKGKYLRSYRGYIFIYAEQYQPDFDYIGYVKKPKGVKKESIPIQDRKMGRKEVLCTTNEGTVTTYPSALTAATKTSIPRTKVFDVLKGRRKSYKGHRFEYTGNQERE